MIIFTTTRRNDDVGLEWWRALTGNQYHLLLIMEQRDPFFQEFYCVKSVQIRSCFWSVISCIWTEYGPEITLYLDTFHAVFFSVLLPKYPLMISYPALLYNSLVNVMKIYIAGIYTWHSMQQQNYQSFVIKSRIILGRTYLYVNPCNVDLIWNIFQNNVTFNALKYVVVLFCWFIYCRKVFDKIFPILQILNLIASN